MSQSGINSMGGAAGVVDFLQGNSGGPVGPNGSNVIFIVGSPGITVAGNAGTNTLTISGSGLTQWNLIAASQTLSPNQGYICTGGGTLSLLLPPVSNLGDIIEVTLDGSAGFTITQAAGQSIRFGDVTTTVGVAGNLASTLPGDTVRLVCQVANLKWNVLSSMGNVTVV